MEPPRDCGLLIKQINDELRKNANNALRPQDMTLAQLDALVELDRAPQGRRALKELEQLLHVAQSTAAGIMTRLERRGLSRALRMPGTGGLSRCRSRRRALPASAPRCTAGRRRRPCSSPA